jgi:hypothetical protein
VGGVLALIVLLVVGGFSLRNALVTKKSPNIRTTQPGGAGGSASASPALLISVTGAQCTVFVKNLHTGNILRSQGSPVPPGTELKFFQDQLPLQVEISSPTCANVFEGSAELAKTSAGTKWIFTVGS